jgi:hypothetical protein
VLDRSGSDQSSLSKRDFLLGIAALQNRGPSQHRLRLFFALCDTDDNGVLHGGDIHRAIGALGIDAFAREDIPELKPGSSSSAGQVMDENTEQEKGGLDVDGFLEWGEMQLAPFLSRRWVWDSKYHGDGSDVGDGYSSSSSSSSSSSDGDADTAQEEPSKVHEATTGSRRRNGTVEDQDATEHTVAETGISDMSSSEPEDLPCASHGLTGLNNIGNTCYLNASLQALSATPPLRAYFLGQFYPEELNFDNPLGNGATLPLAYGALLKRMWPTKAEAGRAGEGEGARQVSAVTPWTFKRVLGSMAPMFRGNHQHDAQEALAALLDGLHEGNVPHSLFFSRLEELSKTSFCKTFA